MEVIEKSLIKYIIYKEMSRIRKIQQELGLHGEEKKRGRYCPSWPKGARGGREYCKGWLPDRNVAFRRGTQPFYQKGSRGGKVGPILVHLPSLRFCCCFPLAEPNMEAHWYCPDKWAFQDQSRAERWGLERQTVNVRNSPPVWPSAATLIFCPDEGSQSFISYYIITEWCQFFYTSNGNQKPFSFLVPFK